MKERKAFLVLNLCWLALLAISVAARQPWLALFALLTWMPVFDRSRRPFLPSLMFHSVSDHYHRFPKSELCVSLRNFRWAMAWLKWRGFHTISFAEAEAFTQGAPTPRRAVHLTFDDGYLDNWVNVWPLLERLGLRGTVFVTADFIDRAGAPRPVRGAKDGPRELDEWGFMNQAEILLAARSGVLEFLPHGKTHTWYPREDRLAGFHLPGDRQVWLDWNLRPQHKARWIQDFPQGFAAAGWPILAFGKSLEVRRFLADEHVLADFHREVVERALPLAAEALEEHWRDFRARHPSIGRPETEAERLARLREELESTRLYLEELLGRPCPYFCWPGGGRQEESLRLAYETLGYRMTTTHQQGIPNQAARPDRWLYRVGPGHSPRYENPVWNLLTFIGHVETQRRNYCWISLFALVQAVEGLAGRLGRRRRTRDRVLPLIGLPLKA